ncbi:hypothetical protein EYF80_015617 [Liparis tanakae]|uniref:Uncharacterized protein n=1 Tax=Liparis tanakae TaxID=230148 RepID=A0A4Z2I9V1_9TELE|nr:hypothetical protein EYF80_015617 [Liparis tanakae]
MHDVSMAVPKRAGAGSQAEGGTQRFVTKSKYCLKRHLRPKSLPVPSTFSKGQFNIKTKLMHLLFLIVLFNNLDYFVALPLIYGHLQKRAGKKKAGRQGEDRQQANVEPMKKRGMKRRVDTVSMATEKRGMVFRDRPAFFMMTPPISIPTATAGRFTAPGNRVKLSEQNQKMLIVVHLAADVLYCRSRNLLRNVARPAITEEKQHWARTSIRKRGLNRRQSAREEEVGDGGEKQAGGGDEQAHPPGPHPAGVALGQLEFSSCKET